MKKIISVILMICICMSATAALAAGEWTCASCGTINAQNFCVECGAAKPAWTCSVCGQSNSSRFCGNCGNPQESAAAPQPTAGKTSSFGQFMSSGSAAVKPAAECFEFEKRYSVYDAEDNLLGRFVADAAYAGDYAEGDRVLISLRMYNHSDAEQTAKVTAKVNGSEFAWNEKVFEPGESWYPRLSSEPMQVGEYDVEWFVNGESVMRETYVVRDGESPLRQQLNSSCEITMMLCLWDTAGKTLVEKNVLLGDITMDDPDRVYDPRLQVQNNGTEVVKLQVSVRVNNGATSSWIEQPIEPGHNFGFVNSNAQHVKGENTCVWYVNGFKVLEGEYLMGSLHVPGQQ